MEINVTVAISVYLNISKLYLNLFIMIAFTKNINVGLFSRDLEWVYCLMFIKQNCSKSNKSSMKKWNSKFAALMHGKPTKCKTNTCNSNSDDANQKGQAQKIFAEHSCLDQPYSDILHVCNFGLLLIYIYFSKLASSLSVVHSCVNIFGWGHWSALAIIYRAPWYVTQK